MGMRLNDPRWFRDGQQAEHRYWCLTASDDELYKRQEQLDFLSGLGVLHAEMIWERARITDETRRRRLLANWRERCPFCGGWRYRHYDLAHPTLGFIPCCRDCGWPHADQIYGSNIIYPGPRTGFKLAGV